MIISPRELILFVLRSSSRRALYIIIINYFFLLRVRAVCTTYIVSPPRCSCWLLVVISQHARGMNYIMQQKYTTRRESIRINYYLETRRERRTHKERAVAERRRANN